ncbi:hypothetical protein [Sphingobium yanoikuyae]|jgi:predicted ABC-type ATPase|uniref:hypothetical protein n=1 Tax=Sphingobium yanoikuyae TaxID=13690 RepID=UPI00244890D3|nr:hypothetical protein [Sphingobium yanoikuyae]MDH2153599.1 hypothetical protein [Sphingobium yanoikuyae]
MPEANAIARMRDDRMAARRDAQNPESDAMRAARRARHSHQINQLKTSQPVEPARHQPDIIKLF